VTHHLCWPAKDAVLHIAAVPIILHGDSRNLNTFSTLTVSYKMSLYGHEKCNSDMNTSPAEYKIKNITA
jgi:hypothetical protein